VIRLNTIFEFVPATIVAALIGASVAIYKDKGFRSQLQSDIEIYNSTKGIRGAKKQRDKLKETIVGGLNRLVEDPDPGYEQREQNRERRIAGLSISAIAVMAVATYLENSTRGGALGFPLLFLTYFLVVSVFVLLTFAFLDLVELLLDCIC